MIVTVIDGQGGRIGALLCEKIKKSDIRCVLRCVGTNSVATTAMLKAGAETGATGENPIIVCSRDSDIITGPFGIVAADSMLGEITPASANAVASSKAFKVLIPVSKCRTSIAGISDISLSELVNEAVKTIGDICRG